jgi:basic amino acid/polyamine antiporter, APA family
MASLGLKRVLGLPEITFIAIGFTIGGGVFVLTGVVFKIAGPALPIAYALAAIPVFVCMMPIAMLGSAIPSTGGNYKYPSRMVSPGLAFVGIWVYALASFVGQIPLYALGCANYARVYLPGISPVTLAVALLTLFYGINLFGVKPAAQIQASMVVTLIVALLFYAFRGFSVLDGSHFSEALQQGGGNILLGTALLTFTYLGANGIIELGGEIRNPGRVIPRAFLITFLIVASIYILVAIATVGAAPGAVLRESSEPLVTVSQAIFGEAGRFFFVWGGAILALVTTLNALFIVGTKSLLIMVQDGLLPSPLGRMHSRFGTPHILLTVIWALSIAGTVSGFSLETLASYAALGGLIIFLPVQLAALRLPTLYPGRYEHSGFKLRGWWLWFCPGVGGLMVVFFGLVILHDLGSPAKVGGFLAFVLSGIAYYHARKRSLRARGIDIGALKGRDDWD